MALKDVLMNIIENLFGQKTAVASESEIIDTADINKIPKDMLEELSNGKEDGE